MLVAAGCVSTPQPQMTSVTWEPAVVRVLWKMTMNAYKANGDCQEYSTLEAVVASPGRDEQKTLQFEPWGSDVWEDGRVYEVEIGQRLSRGEQLRPVIRQKKPNKAPEPTPGSVTLRASSR